MSSRKFKQAPKLVCFISQSLIKFHQEGLLFQLRKSTFKFEKKKKYMDLVGGACYNRTDTQICKWTIQNTPFP